MAAKSTVSDDEWHRQTDFYELGLKHANEIARDLGVSPQTVSRRMQRMGAIKASRVAESIAPLVTMLDRKAKRAALMALSDNERRRRAAEASCKAAGHLVAALIAADQQGDITLANSVVDRMGQALSNTRRRRL